MTHAKKSLFENDLNAQINQFAIELGFSQIGIAGIELSDCEAGFLSWLEKGFHGSMEYMQKHGLKRLRPSELVPGTVRVITARMNYLPESSLTPHPDWRRVEFSRLDHPTEAIVSMYARGRDYHKVLRKRLQQLADKIAALVGSLGYRVFTDSAPVFEVELAQRSGLGWRGKHTLLLNQKSGSTFFLGEIFIDAPLAITASNEASHCGSCTACLDICPTKAIVAPFLLDARRCISYLTIEHKGSIPEELRPLMANRIYGCDDCQLICPWNKFAKTTTLSDFDVRHQWKDAKLETLFLWSETDFLRNTEGSPIYRIGHEQWLRNIAIALGNAKHQGVNVDGCLAQRMNHPSELVREHVAWALLRSNPQQL